MSQININEYDETLYPRHILNDALKETLELNIIYYITKIYNLCIW